jgi:signal-transduction protein with cAMP-binding, CBS, and nucleotidyltransferase domain
MKASEVIQEIERLIEKQRDLITRMLNKEFTDIEVANLWAEINELINLEIKVEEDCNI